MMPQRLLRERSGFSMHSHHSFGLIELIFTSGQGNRIVVGNSILILKIDNF